jgi:hypothetical protein
MPLRAATPPLAQSRDGTVYLVLDSQADRKTVVADLLSGQYRYRLRVVAFAEGRARDIIAEIPSFVRTGISVP